MTQDCLRLECVGDTVQGVDSITDRLASFPSLRSLTLVYEPYLYNHSHTSLTSLPCVNGLSTLNRLCPELESLNITANRKCCIELPSTLSSLRRLVITNGMTSPHLVQVHAPKSLTNLQVHNCELKLGL